MYRLALLCLSLSLIFLNGCDLSNGHTLEYEDIEREYELFLPPSLSKRSGKNKPLLLVLHGNPSAGWQMRLYSGMDKVARNGDFIVAYPTARTGKWPLEHEDEIIAETGYIESVLDDVVSRYPVDTTRIYVCGISGGGIFSIILADRISDRLAAIGVVAGNLPKSIPNANTIQPIPTVIFHGTEDFLYNGRPHLHSVDSTITALRHINGCTDQHVTTQIENRRNDGTTVDLLTYDCSTPLQFYRISGGGHHWPGGTFNADRFTKLDLGPFCRDIDASELIWKFVSKHHK